MIFFRQFKIIKLKSKLHRLLGTPEEARIEEEKSVKTLSMKYLKTGEIPLQGNPLQGNVVDLETGEIHSRRSCYILPAWVLDPTVRAIRVAQWKQRQKNKQTRKEKARHENKRCG
jgi:hypothetical protein